MLILTVKFTSALALDEVLAVLDDRIPDFRALPGLIQKYYGHDQESGAYTGIYIWESEEALQAYRESALAQTIAAAYQVTAPPRIEVFEVIETLRPVAVAAAAS